MQSSSLNANGIKYRVNEREALECGGLDAALQRLPPILISGLNAIVLKTRLHAFSLPPRSGG
jgi:hypothetical protein